jgi:hypothetical protein
VPLIVVSGHSRQQLIERGLLPEGVPFLAKPFDLRELMATAERVRALAG